MGESAGVPVAADPGRRTHRALLLSPAVLRLRPPAGGHAVPVVLLPAVGGGVAPAREAVELGHLAGALLDAGQSVPDLTRRLWLERVRRGGQGPVPVGFDPGRVRDPYRWPAGLGARTGVKNLLEAPRRTGGRVVEGSGLESWRTLTGLGRRNREIGVF